MLPNIANSAGNKVSLGVLRHGIVQPKPRKLPCFAAVPLRCLTWRQREHNQANFDDAFRKYLGEDAPTYVERESKVTEDVVAFARASGGIPVLAHPIRLSLPRITEAAMFEHLQRSGLAGLEVYHSEHPPALQAYYRELAAELNLLPTGGSDFHGAVKPDIELGSGRANNVRVPVEFLEGLRRFAE